MGRRDDIARAAQQAKERAKSTAGRGADLAGGAVRRGGTAAGGAVARGKDAVGTTVKSGRDLGGAALSTSTKAASAAAGKGAALGADLAGKGAALGADLAKAAMRIVPQQLEALGSPTLPLESRWGMGMGAFLGQIDGIPKALRPKLAAQLDKVGSVFISPTNLEFDGEVIEWRNVKTITLGSPTDAMSARAAQELVERLRVALPKFPGRTFVMRQAAEFVIALCLAGAQPTAAGPDGEPGQVVTSIRYAGRLRQKELRPGIFAIQLSAMKPDVATAVVETSRPFGTVVKIDPARKAAARAVAVRDLALRLRKQIAAEVDDE
jgi:hypothetical protein